MAMLQVLAAFIVYGPLQLVIQSHCLLTCRYIALSSTVLPVLKCSECRYHSRPQRPRLVWSVPRIATSGKVQHRQSAIHELPVTLCMLRVKSDKSDWLKVRKKSLSMHKNSDPAVLTTRRAASGDEKWVATFRWPSDQQNGRCGDDNVVMADTASDTYWCLSTGLPNLWYVW